MTVKNINGVKIYIYKESIKTVGPKLILYTAWRRPKTKARSGFIAESQNKQKLISYLRRKIKY